MDSDSEREDTARRGDDDQSSTELWGAKDSLKRHVGRRGGNKSSQSLDEVTPLLAGTSDSPLPYENNESTPEWEGYADYEGLSRWQRPSVCPMLCCLCEADKGRCTG